MHYVGRSRHTLKVLTWDGTGAIVVHKQLDVGKFELPKATRDGDQDVIVSDAIFEVVYECSSGARHPNGHSTPRPTARR